MAAMLALAAGPAWAQPVDPAQHRMTLHEVNVGQGVATLLEFPCAAVLIDAGGEGEADGPAADHLIAYLDGFFAARPDLHNRLAAVFITHTHKDHNIALRRVAERYEIGGYLHNGVLHGSGAANANWMAQHVAAAGGAIPSVALTEDVVHARTHAGYTDAVVDPVKCDAVDPQIRVLSGAYPTRPAGWSTADFLHNGNLQSLVIRIDFGKASFLFTGDLEEAGIATLLGNYAGQTDLHADVYHVGHHGSYNGTTSDLLVAVNPKMAVMGMGDGTVHAKYTAWDYGHPRQRAVSWLDAAITTGRPEKQVVVFDSVKFGHPEADDHAVYETYDLKHALYGTGWDGDVDIQASDEGRYVVTTSH